MKQPWNSFQTTVLTTHMLGDMSRSKSWRVLGRLDELLKLLDPPQNQDEAVKVISLLLDNNRFNEASERLQAMSTLIGQPLFGELLGVVEARRATA